MNPTFQAIDPATRSGFRELAETTPEQVDGAVARARDTLANTPEWRVPRTRAQALARLARAIEAEAEMLAQLECRDTGKPLRQAVGDVAATVRYFDFYAGATDKFYGYSIPLGPDFVDYTVREPWGVCGQIIPWNYPLQILARCSAPALATGNAVIVKPSENGSVTPTAIAQLAESSGLAPGLFQVLTGHAPAGDALIKNPAVDHITFVGSAAVGRSIARSCADRLAPVQLELGGKSPHVVFADADLQRAAPVIVGALVQNAGQSCSAGSRLIVARSRHDELVELIAQRMEQLKIGAGVEDPDLGPLISEKQLERALGMVQRVSDQGARIALGGTRVSGREDGWYLAPTIVCDVAPGSEIFEEEVFGPVLAVSSFEDDDLDAAIGLANATPYGLVGAVWTSDIGRAHRTAQRIQAGQVYVNGYGVAGGIELPFGGMKRSGYGRGKGMEAMHAYSQIKNICVAL